MKTDQIYLKLKDHAVSGDAFELRHDDSRALLYTHPKPTASALSSYYPETNYISHTNQRRSLFDVLYHVVRYATVKRKLRLLKPFQPKEGTLLDVGAGTGYFSRAAQNSGWDVTGIEPNASARTLANSKEPNTVFDSETLQNLDHHSFDVITLWHVLEHLPDLDNDLKLFKTLLKPNGRIIIAVPNFKSFDAFFFRDYWAAYDVPRHLWHFSQQSITNVFSEIQMKLESTYPLLMDAYYVSLLSNKLKSGSHRMLSSLRIGFLSNLKARKSGEYSSLIYVLKNKN
ncbi:MAG: class I SAM-dependent methyltransferase [Flavobacteriaceae bacterium]|jgi:2-polyprenyl-3-methyl-5-hydroxy-6-metoxy-1,4-benzoquinol methylase|nr:class I SAM-dependent methyltransferase [Flavobacteriaceae bacterium]